MAGVTKPKLSVEDEIHENIVWEGRIAEMGPLDSSTHPDLQMPEDFITKIKAKDDDPLFVTVEVEAGMSKSKRKWTMEHLNKVINKVNSERMTGYLGHPLLKKDDYESAYPPPQVVWAAAKVVNSNTAAFKGYVLKRADARTDLELGIIDGVSIFGPSTMKPTPGGYEILAFDPETIDFARKGRSGMPSRIVALTGEQDTSRGGAVEPKDVAALSPDEIKTHAPLVFKAIQDEAVAPLQTQIGEMTTAATAIEPDMELLASIKSALKLTDGENPLEKITNLLQKVEELGTSEIKGWIKEVVGKKVKTERGQALVHRLLGEMHTEYEGALTDDLKAKIEADVVKKMEEDEDVKELVGEMAPFGEERSSSRGSGGASLGGRSRTGSERGRENGGKGDGVVSRNDNLTVRRVRVGS